MAMPKIILSEKDQQQMRDAIRLIDDNRDGLIGMRELLAARDANQFSLNNQIAFHAVADLLFHPKTDSNHIRIHFQNAIQHLDQKLKASDCNGDGLYSLAEIGQLTNELPQHCNVKTRAANTLP